MATVRVQRRVSDARYRRALKAYGREIDAVFASHMRDVLLGIERAGSLVSFDQGPELDEEGRPVDIAAAAELAFWEREARKAQAKAERIRKPDAIIQREGERIHTESVRSRRAGLVRAGAKRSRVAAQLGIEAGEVVGVDMRLTIAELAAQDNWVRANLRLVNTLPQRQVQEWAGWMSREIAAGRTYRSLERRIRTEAGKGEWHAERIARDQVNKAQAQIGQAFAREIGSDWYIWRVAARDGRTRESHLDVADRYWRYSEGAPGVDVDGGDANPGEPILCRCRDEIWIPPQLLGLPPSAEPTWGARAR